jgi:hypothetical protein
MIGNPLKFMERMYNFILKVIDQLNKKLAKQGLAPEVTETYYITPQEYATIFHAPVT